MKVEEEVCLGNRSQSDFRLFSRNTWFCSTSFTQVMYLNYIDVILILCVLLSFS